MKNIFKRVAGVLLATTMVLGLASCGKEVVTATLEMPYATSSEASVSDSVEQVKSAYGIEFDFTFADNTITMTVDEEIIPKVMEKINTEKDHFITQYATDGYVNSIEVNEDYTSLTIDFKSTAEQANIDEVYTEYLGLAMLYQAFNKVPSDQFSLNVILKVDGQVVIETVVDKALMIQS